MTELTNPLFEEEKEFLERKKLEYERALRGDVEHIKDQSVVVGKVALVGAGLAGGIWLISKAFGRKKRKPHYLEADEYDWDDSQRADIGPDDYLTDDDESEEGHAEYYTAGNGQRYKSKVYRKPAAASAQVFMQEFEGETDDIGFGSAAPAAFADTHEQPHAAAASSYEDDPFQDLPYDDSRRLLASDEFDEEDDFDQAPAAKRPSIVGPLLQSFLQSDTGKVLVAQAAAVVLALVTKKVSEFFPAAKNPDLATSPGYAPAETGFSPVASPASPVSPDASSSSQPS